MTSGMSVKEGRASSGLWSFVLAAILGLVLVGCALDPESPEGVEGSVPSSEEEGTLSAGDAADSSAPLFALEGRPVVERDGVLAGDQNELSYGYLYGEHNIAGGLFGVSYDFVFGLEYCPWDRPREYSEAWTYNGAAQCWIVRWYNDGDPHDCRVVVHAGAAAFTGGICVMRVWVQ